MPKKYLPKGTDFLACEETIGDLIWDWFTAPGIESGESSKLKYDIAIEIRKTRRRNRADISTEKGMVRENQER